MDWIVGDLHGMLHTLKRLVERVAARDAAPRFVFVGDYADRGPFARGLVDYLLALPYAKECLRGNHDDVIDYLLNGQCCSELGELMIGRVTPGNVCVWWLENGFLATMESYGVADSPVPKGVYAYFDYTPVAEAFRAAVPEAHKQFYRSLRLFWENETHFACHGFWRPEQKLPRDLKSPSAAVCTDVLWMRFQGSAAQGIGSSVPVWDKIGVFGHTPVEVYGSSDMIRFPKMRLIDTGAWLGRQLTAYCCQTDGVVEQAVVSEDKVSLGA
jgi:serine/threonine protein phosphatase 1